jgi:hypothetical protein
VRPYNRALGPRIMNWANWAFPPIRLQIGPPDTTRMHLLEVVSIHNSAGGGYRFALGQVGHCGMFQLVSDDSL